MRYINTVKELREGVRSGRIKLKTTLFVFRCELFVLLADALFTLAYLIERLREGTLSGAYYDIVSMIETIAASFLLSLFLSLLFFAAENEQIR